MKYFSINLPPPIQHRKIPNTLKAGYPILGIDANESTQETIAYGCQQSQKNFKGKVMNTQSTTPVHALQDLQQYANAEALTPALHDLCSHFGSIKKLVVLTAKHEGIKQAICFLRLASEDQEKHNQNTCSGTPLPPESRPKHRSRS